VIEGWWLFPTKRFLLPRHRARIEAGTYVDHGPWQLVRDRIKVRRRDRAIKAYMAQVRKDLGLGA